MVTDLLKTPPQKMAVVCKLLARLGGEIVDLRSNTEMGTSFQYYVPLMTAAQRERGKAMRKTSRIRNAFQNGMDQAQDYSSDQNANGDGIRS